MSCETLKKPSPYSDDQVHLFVLFQPVCELKTSPCMSQTSTHGISSTGRPEIARHFRWIGCRLGNPPLSTVLSTFSKSIRYEGASVGFASESTLWLNRRFHWIVSIWERSTENVALSNKNQPSAACYIFTLRYRKNQKREPRAQKPLCILGDMRSVCPSETSHSNSGRWPHDHCEDQASFWCYSTKQRCNLVMELE
jgi:hypothetical protein